MSTRELERNKATAISVKTCGFPRVCATEHHWVLCVFNCIINSSVVGSWAVCVALICLHRVGRVSAGMAQSPSL